MLVLFPYAYLSPATYRIYLTKDGQRGFTNEMAASRPDADQQARGRWGPSCIKPNTLLPSRTWAFNGVYLALWAAAGMTAMVMRLYGSDPGADTSDPSLEPWGYVKPIRISVKLFG